MPAGECELIFVDDGSTDGTGERLDALAAEHAHVRVEHIPNSGWPGKPRNVGLDMAKGEFVYFVDNDDWLGEEALARLHAMALTDDADIVVGKVIGHGKYITRGIFVQNRHDLTVEDAPFGLLTPHKLFRRALLQEHGIRFPEGRRRLEDHIVVVEAYFRARRISVLADYACYHWVLRDRARNASFQRTPPADYYAAVRDVLDIVDEHTEPGDFRDRLYMRWYRGKLLGRVGGRGFAAREPDYRRAVVEEVRKLVEERFPPRFDERLPYAQRLRADLLRRGSVEGLEALADYEGALHARARAGSILGDGTWLTVRCKGRLWQESHGGLELVRRGERLHWDAPPALRELLGEDALDVTDELADGQTRVFLKSVADDTEWELPADVRASLPEESDGDAIRPRVGVRARLAPTIGAGGAPVPPGEYDLRVNVSIAGFASVSRARVAEDVLTVTITPALRIETSLPAKPPPPPPPPPPALPTSLRATAVRTALRLPGAVPAVRGARRVPGLAPAVRRIRASARR
jgi:glycosyltransferase involved in cell wall biosynthesis